MNYLEKWYLDQTLSQISLDCDNAYYSNDKNGLNNLADKCYQEGHNKSYSEMVRAKYLYNSFTSLGDWIDLSIKTDISNGEYESQVDRICRYESIYEKCLYLIRTALNICKMEYKKADIQNFEYKGHLDGLHLSMVVNYSNLLSQNGRLIKSLEELRTISAIDFPMGVGHLGMKLVDYANFDYDGSHQSILCYSAYHYLVTAMQSKKQYPEKLETTPLFEAYKQRVVSLLGVDYLEKHYTIRDFLKKPKHMGKKEGEYRKWCAEHTLCLNTLNEISCDTIVAYDSIHLPPLVDKVGTTVIPHYHGLFNQIKQEYVSARFLAYEGLTQHDTHFSDKGVYLVNTLDYPVYGLSIEKVKAAYRSIYAIFDRISYFLNTYYELGIKEREVDFIRLWSPRDSDHKKIGDCIKTNYPLLGLWWLYKDIKNKTVYQGQKFIDPVLSKISEIRNAMEHRYLKIINFILDDRKDELATIVCFSDFESMTIALLKYAREAIILLVMAIHVEEENRNRNQNTDRLVAHMPLSTYEDDWKRIF